METVGIIEGFIWIIGYVFSRDGSGVMRGNPALTWLKAGEVL